MTTIYADSSYCTTIYVSGQKIALSADRLATFASLTNGGTIPHNIRWQYSAKYVINGSSTPSNPSYNGFGPLDETVDKIMGTPGLRLILNLAYFPTSWCALDTTGKNVGYGNGVLPDGPAMAIYAGKIAQRYNTGAYAGLIDSGKIILQIFNEEMDTGLNGATGGTILAPIFNYAVPAIQAFAPNAIVVAGAVRNLSSGGVHIHDWMTNLFTYVPKAGEPAQSLPYAVDIHCYFNGSNITSNGNTAPDPTTTDNSATPASAKRPSVQGNISIIQGVLNAHSPGTQIWMLENGENIPNNSPNNKNSNPSVLPSQQSRYQLSVMAQMQFLGASKYALYTLQANDDPKELCGAAISDLVTYINANPQWAGVAAPTDKLYQSVDALSFEGTVGTAPIDQYFSIMNPTGSNQTWSIGSSQTWLVAKTLPTNGMKGTAGANLTGGTLAAGQCITLKATADSTANGLTTLTSLSATLTVTIGGNVSHIAVSLFVTPNAANPNITSGSAGPQNGPTFTMTANASPAANQTITFKNQDGYATWWYAFSTCNWFTINTASGNLGAGSTQNITISIASIASTLAPGTYTENLTISATPFPPTYTTDAPPTTTQFITVIVTLKINKSSSSAVQLSTSTFNFSAVASGALPAAQTFYLLNCRNATDNWTVAKTQSWLTLSPTSGSNLPANGSSTGTNPNIQHTDYAVVTASINSTALSAGTYTDTITVTLGSATATIAVSYVVTSTGSTLTIGATPTTPTIPSQVQGGTPVTATTTLTNSGNTTGTYHHTTTYTHGTGFLAMSPGSATLTASGGTQVVTFTCTPGSLAPDTYTATVIFTLGTSTATVNISFTVTASGGAAVLAVSPAALLFNDVVGEALAPPQNVTLSNTGNLDGAWAPTISYTTGNNWIVLSPPGDTLTAGTSEPVTVTMNDIGLAIGTYTATITFTAGASSIQVSVTLIINAITVASSAQMTQSDMAAQYAYILSTVVGQQLDILARTFYGSATNAQVIYGELDALFPFETMSLLHVMKSLDDVTAFLNAYAYVAQVLSDSPIVYYRLGEASGIYAYDTSGRKMTGLISTSSGAIVGVTQGQVGALTNSPDTAYLFDGSSGNILLPAGVNTANWSALSVEAWIKLSNITFSQTAFVIANDAPLSTNLGFNLAVTKSSVIFRIGTGSAYAEINQPYTFSANTWYHLAAVFSGSALAAYINGNPIASNAIVVAPPYVSTVLANTPIRYHRLDESSGTVVRDLGSQAQNGTLHGGVTLAQPGLVTGDSDTAMLFDGSTGYISLPTTGLPTGAQPWSMECWVKFPTVPGAGHYPMAMNMGNGAGGHDASLYFHGDVQQFAFGFTGLTDIFSSVPVVANHIYYLVGTYDGTTGTFYCYDGTAGISSTNSHAEALSLTYGGAFIGSLDGSTFLFSGIIDEPAMYSYALTPVQVATDYDAGQGLKFGPSGPGGNWALAWHDEFDGASLDSSKWNGGWFNGPSSPGVGVNAISDPINPSLAENYFGPASIVFPGDGAVHLKLQNGVDNSGSYHGKTVESGIITTAGLMNLNPGNVPVSTSSPDLRPYTINGPVVLEFRARVPGPNASAAGYWPGVFLTNAGNYGGTSPNGTQWPGGENYLEEIDLIEWFGGGSLGSGSALNFHAASSYSASGIPSSLQTTDLSLAYHTYTYMLTATGLQIWVDGISVPVSPTAAQVAAQWSDPQYLLIDFQAVAGATIPAGNDFMIDYVRVWQSGPPSSVTIAQTTNVVNIASKPGTTANNFPGTLDEISLYNSALSAARVQVHYLGRLSGTSQTGYATLIVADGPVAYWRMNESSGTVAHDSTSNHFDATLSGNSLSYSVAGVLTTDTAIGFGGSDSLIFPSSLVLANYAGYSLEYWINITQGWQHIVITVDASGNTLYYLNGASYSSGSGDAVVVDIDVYYTGSFSAGSLDEIAVYPYVLSAAQVANHFNVGSLGV